MAVDSRQIQRLIDAQVAGGPATVADGADVTQGALADAVVAAGAAGSLSAKLRRLTTDLAALSGKLPAAATPADATALAAMSQLMAVQMGFNGATLDMLRLANVFKNVAAVSITAATPSTIWTPTTGKKFRVLGFLLGVSAACSVLFKYGSGSTEFLRTPVIGTNASVLCPPLGEGLAPGAANDVLKLDISSGTAIVSGFVFGTEE